MRALVLVLINRLQPSQGFNNYNLCSVYLPLLCCCQVYCSAIYLIQPARLGMREHIQHWGVRMRRCHRGYKSRRDPGLPSSFLASASTEGTSRSLGKPSTKALLGCGRPRWSVGDVLKPHQWTVQKCSSEWTVYQGARADQRDEGPPTALAVLVLADDRKTCWT